MQSFPDLRIITKAARLYYEERLTQTEIAARLEISCNYVSHILRQSLMKLRKVLTSAGWVG